jgi:hypothetical protein
MPTIASEYISVQRKREIPFVGADPRDSPPCYFHTHGRDELCAGDHKKRKSLEGERWEENERQRNGGVRRGPHPPARF